MSKIDDFKKSKRDLYDARTWASKIGDKYFGGTSGKGELGAIVNAKVSFTVYHQYADGAKNYHDSPDALDFAMGAVLKRNHKALIDEAISDLERASKSAAQAAATEYATLLAEAGLEHQA